MFELKPGPADVSTMRRIAELTALAVKTVKQRNVGNRLVRKCDHGETDRKVEAGPEWNNVASQQIIMFVS